MPVIEAAARLPLVQQAMALPGRVLERFSLHDTKRLRLWQLAHALVMVTVICVLRKTPFLSAAVDGFTSGIIFIDNFPASRLHEHPLYIVHLFRYLSVVLLWKINGSALAPLVSALYFLALLWPLVAWPLNGKTSASPWRVLMFYLPCAFSMRATLASIGIAYLLMVFTGTRCRRVLLALSGMGANMSSASVLIWLAVCAANLRHMRRLGLTGVAVTLLMMFSIFASMMHKIPFFNSYAIKFELNQTVEGINDRYDSALKKYLLEIFNIHNAEELEQSPWWVRGVFIVETVVDNNTIMLSVVTGRYVRAAFYIFLLCVFLCSLRSARRGDEFDRLYFRSMVWGIPFFFVEGLGVLSLIAPLMLYITERSPRRLLS